MSTMSLTTFGLAKSGAPVKANPAHASKSVAPSVLHRLMDAVVESKRRRAEIEVRRVRALVTDNALTTDYAMLPFSGQ
jgi:hypothetical protein